MNAENFCRMGVLVVFLCLVVFLVPGKGGIIGSAHDFSGAGWSGNRVCASCHTPHGADTSVEAPLWNHSTTTATFTLYSSATLESNPDVPTDSLLCLSCHDGTEGLDSFGGASGTTFIDGAALVGVDLSNMHPIGFAYDLGLVNENGFLYDPEAQTTPLGGTITEDLLSNTGNMSCMSCHDVHNKQENEALLHINNSNSALCLTCHNM